MNRTLLTKLEEAIKEQVPEFEVRFKNEGTLMKWIGKILFFNKSFLTKYVTTRGKIPYWPNKENYESNPDSSFETLAHEFIHIMDYMLKPISFTLSYLFPQILALPGLISLLLLPILIFISPWWLLMLLFLVFLAPMPSPGRKNSEVRGYGMSLRVTMWREGRVSIEKFDSIVNNFIGPNYYYMWPYEKEIRRELCDYSLKNDPICIKNDPNPAWKIVYNVLKENGALHE
jgi:hypothetical protein